MLEKDKIARSGLELEHLKAALNRGGVDATKSILSERFNSKVRVTSNKNIITAIAAWLEMHVKMPEEYFNINIRGHA